MNADMFRRLDKAASQDESPLAEVLTSLGMPAHRNVDISTQKKHGDVIFAMTDGSRRSFECQVSSKYTNFSYASHKVKDYVGVGKPEHAYVLLGCRANKTSDKMFYLIMEATQLHKLLSDNEGRYLSEDKKYFKIPPGDLTCLTGIKAPGDTIEEATKEFALQLVGS